MRSRHPGARLAALAAVAVMTVAAAGCTDDEQGGGAAGTSFPEASGPSTTSDDLRFGAAVKGSDPAAVEALEAQAGAPLGVVRTFARWDTPFPTAEHRAILGSGHRMHLSVRPRYDDGTVVLWSEVAAARPGSPVYDRMVEWAEAVAPYTDQLYLTFNHEPETRDSQANGTAEEFVAAFRRWNEVMAEHGAGDIPRVVVLTRGAFADGRIDQWYPGDAAVDVIGVDAYNWFDCQGSARPWLTPAELLEPAARFAAERDKPMAVPEVASTEDPADPGRKAEWITDLGDDVASLSEQQPVTFVAWFDVHDAGWPNCNWSFSSSPASAEAMAANVSRFAPAGS
ncbi:MAG: hypothetical protein ACK5RL_16295 [Acidimicrobiales bacterium]